MRRLQAVQQRHGDVHDDDVRLQLRGETHSFAAIRRFADHFHLGDAVKQKFQPGPYDPVIVRDQDANHRSSPLPFPSLRFAPRFRNRQTEFGPGALPRRRDHSKMSAKLAYPFLHTYQA